MIFKPTPIPGAQVVELERNADDRGYFARTWCREDFERHGIAVDMVQASVSHNQFAGTLRGMHFAWPPSREAKLVRCERGKVRDVILDLRPSSAAFLVHFSVDLDAELGNAIYIPAGVAHGFQTLVDGCTVLYMMTDIYRPELGDGVRFDDPAFGIIWPRPVTSIHERDRDYADFVRSFHIARYNVAAQLEPTP